MDKLKKIIHDKYKYNTKDILINISELNDNNRKELLDTFLNSKFKIPEISDFIKKCSYKIVFKNEKFNILLFDNDIDDLLVSRIKKICTRVNILYEYFNIKENLNIWILPVEIIKKFPKDGTEISEININGGFTYVNGNNIYIYRLEEFPKVIIHEVIHHTYIDTYNKWSFDQINYLKNIFNISTNSEFNPNESIVELWATLFHLLFISYELNISFEYLYKNELKWSFIQSNNLLSHKESLCNYYNCKWHEKTNAYSYIYIKTVLLYNLYKVINIEVNIDKLIKLIDITLKNKNFMKCINKYKYDKNILRMTIYGDL